LFGAGLLADFVEKGLVAGFGAFLVFVPQIWLLFLLIEALDDTGYLARAAFLLDRIMGSVGLPGRAFLPLLSGFACAIPAILATRTIENKTDRFVTILVTPLMSCQARLPVYSVIVSALFMGFAWWVPAVVVASMYVLGIVIAFAGAKILRRTLQGGPRSPLLLELPPYRMPSVRTVLRNTGRRTWSFVSGAGPIIFGLTVVLWFGMTFPRDVDFTQDYDGQIARAEQVLLGTPEDETVQAELKSLRDGRESERLSHTFMGAAAQLVEPVFEPLGFDWKIDVAILGSFAAREVFVPTLGVIYSVGEAEADDAGLLDRIRGDTWPDGRPVFTPLVGISLLVFYVIALQCMSTLAVIKREMNSWKWAAACFFTLTALAYLASLAVFQVGSLLGF
jgi:ferrous iron transport protein B